MSIRITCIKKDGGYHENPHIAISILGWIEDGSGNTGRATRVEMYDFVKEGGVAYVRDSRGDTARLMTGISPGGTKYVKTVPDTTKADNLLKLPECTG